MRVTADTDVHLGTYADVIPETMPRTTVIGTLRTWNVRRCQFVSVS